MIPQNTTKTRTLPKEAEPYKWKPGQSGNPGGRPRKIVSEAYQRRMALPLPEDVCKAARLRKGSTWADLAALGMAKAAIKGRADAAREITDRLEGKAMQQIELSGPDGGPIVVDDLAAGRARVKEWREKHGKT